MPPGAAFLHIPKTAGTTLINLLVRQGPEWRPLRTGTVFKDPERCRRRMAALGRAAATPRPLIYGHFPFAYADLLPADTRYVTLLREPVERTLSHCHHLIARPEVRHFGLPALPPGATVWDCLEGGHVPDNLQVRMLVDGELPPGPCPEEALDRAETVLRERFAVVGVCERFDETLALLRRELGLGNVLYANERVNTARPRGADVPADVLEAVREHTRLDARLYAVATELLDAGLARGGGELAAEVCAIAAVNAAQSDGTRELRREALAAQVDMARHAERLAREIDKLKARQERMQARIAQIDAALREARAIPHDAEP